MPVTFFAFTATPKNKTLELFGVPFQDGDITKFRAFHLYSMKQAINEGFIMGCVEKLHDLSKLLRVTQKD